MKYFFALFLVLSICTNCFAQGEFPNKNQFAVKCEDGTVFELDTDIENVFNKLGEPLYKKNIWEIYPEASCAFYIIDYGDISFCYYDIDNKIIRITLKGDKYKILDNDITVGSTYNEIIESYGYPHKELEFFNEDKGIKEIQVGYTTQNTDLFYIKQTVEYFYGASFNFDLNKDKCNFIILNYCMNY